MRLRRLYGECQEPFTTSGVADASYPLNQLAAEITRRVLDSRNISQRDTPAHLDPNSIYTPVKWYFGTYTNLISKLRRFMHIGVMLTFLHFGLWKAAFHGRHHASHITLKAKGLWWLL